MSEGPLVVLTQVPERIAATARRELESAGWRGGRSTPASLVGRALAAQLVAAHWRRDRSELHFERSPDGKPLVRDGAGTQGPAFNLAHSGDRVAVAVAGDGRVGIDVERIAVADRRLIRRVFAIEDQIDLERLEPHAAADEFTRRWAVAEACAKADGTGIRMLLRRFAPIGGSASGRWRDLCWWSGRASGGHWAVAAPGAAPPRVRDVSFGSILDGLQ